MNESLKQALQKATTECSWNGEEEGGIIVRKGDDFLFTKLTNQNTGTRIAAVLYTVHRGEYGEKIAGPDGLFSDGWINYASFHTHPNGCNADPSEIDFSKLFKGFQYNYIYAPWCKTVNKYTKLDVYEGDKKTCRGYRFEDEDNIFWVKERANIWTQQKPE